MSLSPRSCARTHIGYARQTNEDSCFADDRLGLYVLADGIGGRPHGAQASTVAVHAMISALRLFRGEEFLANNDYFRAAFETAHKAVCGLNKSASGSKEMGTTLSAAVVADEHFIVGNVGDSRVYLVMPDAPTTNVWQISRDHTLAGERGLHNMPREFRVQGALTQAVGIGGGIEPHIIRGRVGRYDALVLCSDGISDYAGDAAVVSILLAFSRNPKKMADTLIRTALTNGGGDNCTCICISISDANR